MFFTGIGVEGGGEISPIVNRNIYTTMEKMVSYPTSFLVHESLKLNIVYSTLSYSSDLTIINIKCFYCVIYNTENGC